MLMNVRDDHLSALHQKMSGLFWIWLWKIEGGPSTKSVTSWDYYVTHVSVFCEKDWTWKGLLQSLFHDCWVMIKKIIAWMPARNWKNCFNRTRVFILTTLQVMKVRFCGYDPKTKQQTSWWKIPYSPRPKKSRQIQSNMKSLLIGFFDADSIMRKEFVPHGHTLNGKFHPALLRWLLKAIIWNSSEKWHKNDWFLHHDNARLQTAFIMHQFLVENSSVLPHSLSINPNLKLSPCDFFLFIKLKMDLKRRIFDMIEEIQAKSQLCSSHWLKQTFRMHSA